MAKSLAIVACCHFGFAATSNVRHRAIFLGVAYLGRSCLRGDFSGRGRMSRAVFLNLAVVSCMLAVAEAYLVTHDYTSATYPDGEPYLRDEVLGWAPAKGSHIHAVKKRGGLHHRQEMLFDVTYTIDSKGLRIAPRYQQNAETALFFGSSFTFGEGLGDSETLPYQVGVQSKGKYRTFNFALAGYNPAQMLAALENGIVGCDVNSRPTYAFYVASPIHVWRVAGRVAWERYAPRYVPDADGAAHREGHFEGRNTLSESLGFTGSFAGQLNKWALWRDLPRRELSINDDDIRLDFAVVRRSEELLTAQYPGIQFRVVLYPDQEPHQRYAYGQLRDGFRKMGVPLDLVADILPGYTTDNRKYILSPLDTHPNALANHLLAQYISGTVLK